MAVCVCGVCGVCMCVCVLYKDHYTTIKD